MNKMFLTMKLFIYLYKLYFILFLFFFFFFSYFVHTFDQKVKTKIELLKKEKGC